MGGAGGIEKAYVAIAVSAADDVCVAFGEGGAHVSLADDAEGRGVGDAYGVFCVLDDAAGGVVCDEGEGFWVVFSADDYGFCAFEAEEG